MTTLDNGFRLRSVGDIFVWSAAALIVMSAHAAALAMMLQPPRAAAVDPGPQAIMIDLAAEQEAAESEKKEVVHGSLDAEETVSSSTDPAPEPIEPSPVETSDTAPSKPHPPEEGMPTEEVVTTPGLTEEPAQPGEAELIEQQVLAALENVAVPLPLHRPAVPMRTPLPEKARPRPEANREAKVDIARSGSTAAAVTAAGPSGEASPAQWQSRLMAHLERRKRYPTAARANHEEGTAYVRFRIDASGNVLSVSLSRSSGHSTLDQAVLDLVRRASPVPAPPPGASTTIVAPVRFNMR